MAKTNEPNLNNNAPEGEACLKAKYLQIQDIFFLYAFTNRDIFPLIQQLPQMDCKMNSSRQEWGHLIIFYIILSSKKGNIHGSYLAYILHKLSTSKWF